MIRKEPLSSAHQMSQATSICPGSSRPSLLLLWVTFPFSHRRHIPTFSRSPPSGFSAPSFFSLSPPPYYKNSFLLHLSGQFQNVFVRHSQIINTQDNAGKSKRKKGYFGPQLQRFWFTAAWPCDFGSVLRLHMVAEHGGRRLSLHHL